MSDKLYDIPDNIKQTTHIDEQRYQAMYQRSIDDPEGFWAEQATEFVSWTKPWDRPTRSYRLLPTVLTLPAQGPTGSSQFP